MCVAIIAFIPFIIVINKNILKQEGPCCEVLTIQPVVAVYDLYLHQQTLTLLIC